MDTLARFYTKDIISDLLVQEIKFSNPQLIIDLGIGAGSLTCAAFQKWSNANFIGTDIDLKQIRNTEKKFPFVKIIEANGLQKNIEKRLNIKVGSVDVAVCNPPYLKISSKHTTFFNLLKKVSLDNCNKLKYLTSDLIFLAQNILLLKEGGELGIILPDGLLSSKEFQIFRQDLVNNHTIVSIIQLPDKIFEKTEARTHILILKKGKIEKKVKVNLFLANKYGKYDDYISVYDTLLVNRMDFLYHKLNQGKCESNFNKETLVEIGAKIKRGQLTQAELKVAHKNYIHTTTLSHRTELHLIDEITKDHYRNIHTAKNDILLARVGRGCIGKVSLVKTGEQLISDCVYRIRVPEKYVKKVWNSLCSSEGQLWLRSNSRGVCARTISKSDLLNFPFRLSLK
jgi:type I restriction enzyme M protein